MTQPRKSLPNRRFHQRFDLIFRNSLFKVGAAWFEDGCLAEVFIQTEKASSHLEDDARDIAVLISIAVQYGIPTMAFREALTRGDDGSAAGLAGAVLDFLEEEKDKVISNGI